MSRQCASSVLMVRPAHFCYNDQTAVDNAFMQEPKDISDGTLQERAVIEFNGMVHHLTDYGIDVVVLEDTPDPVKPDALFPNNWISMHDNGSIITYAMRAEKRRAERREDIIDHLSEKFGFDRRYSLEQYEEKGQYLESTGSMVLDRINSVVYACLSERTNPLILDKFCALTGYERVVFAAIDKDDNPIYHTNVMMCIGDSFALLCAESIVQPHDRLAVISELESSGRELIEINYDQLHAFAGNMIQLKSGKGKDVIVLSEQAFQSLSPDQVDQLKLYGSLLPISIPTIEAVGGGSVRCMMAEIFPPKK
ncbi:MAG: amidinotransferase [Saprospiraceae bacterium]|nr:amidinotransferase [Saprospiraceae bacterium]